MEFLLGCYAFIVLDLWFLVLMVSCNPIFLEGSSDTSAFPSNFLFGTASSSYQFEGAYFSHGKGLSNWDVFTHTPGTIMDGTNGDIAVDHYHRYPEDLDLMEYIGVNSYRFSISWARILPKGRFGTANRAGINHYNKFINELLRIGIQPFVTLTHFDIPQELEDRYGAWLSPEIQQVVDSLISVQSGIFPPSRCSGTFGNCSSGDSEKEPFIAAHNMILSHAAAVNVYRTKYQKKQGGSIGIVMNAIWHEPLSDSLEDKLAVERANAFYMNWFLDPIILGKYPAEMHDILGSDLPIFSKHELEKLKSGVDFIGINQYTSFYVKDCAFSTCEQGPGVSRTEGLYLRTAQKDGFFIGQPTALDWLIVYPQGMEKLVTYFKERYNNIPMYITENGYCEEENVNVTTEAVLKDVQREEYMSSYLDALETAVRKGADVRGYFAWSLLDNFEWTSGYTIKFGLYHVDFSTLKRTRKHSATWYKDYIAIHKAVRTST
ncbi:GLYCOSYL HYDROLASE [Salix purpurea]|uniref:GLYCOSYL HYDROLASE n=1 Tax=Salix purpurea TaxID=77065 RepID=A0A9Q1ADR1_SALPP|nr:GLYCOSYL HYDROLASE [Salix purpurea]